MKPPPGISLGRPVKRMLQGTDRISREPPAGPEAAGLAMTALTRPLLEDAAHRRSSGPSLTGGYAVRPAQAALRPPPTPTRQAVHFPGSPVTGRHAPATTSAGHRAGEGLPVPAVTTGTFRAPYAGESFAAALPGSSPLPWPSPWIRGLGSPCSRPKARPLTTPQASLNATDRTVAAPVTGPLTLGSDPARFQTKPPACYRASWQLPGPDSHRQATTSLRTRR
jgi:hypothetical protein